MSDLEIRQLHLAKFVAAMLLGQDALAVPQVCDHVIKVAVNNENCVCAVCRKRFEEPTSNGITIVAPMNPPSAGIFLTGPGAKFEAIDELLIKKASR